MTYGPTGVNQADPGLDGKHDSFQYRIAEIERHLHSFERWMGAAAIPSGETHVADTDSMTAFQVDAGNDDWGAWVQIMGSSDSPIFPGMAYMDLHRLLIDDVETDVTLTRMQFCGGESADLAANLVAGNYTEVIFKPLKGGNHGPIEVQRKRAPSGIKGWCRAWVNGINTSTVDFFIGLHEYEGN